MKKYKYEESFTYEGRRYRVRADSKEELAVKKYKKRQELESGAKKIEKSMLFRDWAEEWMETYKRSTVSAETYQSYGYVIKNHIIPEIGHLKIASIKPIHVQKMTNKLNGMSNHLINRVIQLTWSIFDAAEANSLVLYNPAKRIKKPNGVKRERRAITEKERFYTLELSKTHPAGIMVKLSLFCGLRPGESCALQWSNVDLKKNILKVENAAKRCGGIGSPKTSAGVRSIPIPASFAEDLRQYKLSCKWPTDPFDYVLRNSQGGRVMSNTVKRLWNSFKNDLNILMGCSQIDGIAVPPYRVSDDLVLYTYRHTYCTDLQDAGVPINVAKDLMGHTDIAITSRIYTHATEKSFNNARDLIDSYHGSSGKEDTYMDTHMDTHQIDV